MHTELPIKLNAFRHNLWSRSVPRVPVYPYHIISLHRCSVHPMLEHSRSSPLDIVLVKPSIYYLQKKEEEEMCNPFLFLLTLHEGCMHAAGPRCCCCALVCLFFSVCTMRFSFRSCWESGSAHTRRLDSSFIRCLFVGFWPETPLFTD